MVKQSLLGVGHSACVYDIWSLILRLGALDTAAMSVLLIVLVRVVGVTGMSVGAIVLHVTILECAVIDKFRLHWLG